jgi:hypothetical protein
MTTVPAQGSAAPARRRGPLERFIGSLPVLGLAMAIVIFYCVEAWTRHTPWIFTDELEWSQISRSIAATGHAARRGQAVSFKSLYAFVIAPFWWIHSTTTAYAAIKYANAVIMASAAIPTYLLGRMLVSRRGALAAAVLSVAVPAMSYVTTIIVEVLAYPYYAWCSLLSVRALRSKRQRDVVLAVLFAGGGLLVRSPQFFTIPLALLIAAAGLWVTGPRGRALRRDWSRSDTLGAIVLGLGVLFLFNRVVLQHVYEWQYTTQYVKNRMVDLGLKAALSLTIGLGILPVVGGLVSLRLPERRGDPVYRAFTAWFAATLLCVSVYTADKAAFLSTNFATLWEERNMIYLSPLLLIATVLVFESRRLDWRLVAAASAFVAFLVAVKGFQLAWPYFEAPGFAIPAILTEYESWSVTTDRVALLGVLAFCLALLAVRHRRGVPALAVVLGAAWLLSGEIANTVGIDNLANAFRSHLPTTLDWVDIADHGQPATYLGQAITDPNGESLIEFWNRSIKNVESLDGTAPGPGPTSRPLVVNADGLLSGISDHYVLADVGVSLNAKLVEQGSGGLMVLYYSKSGRWHLLDNLEQEYSDGWCPGFCAWTYFKPGQRGTLEVTLSRTGYNGTLPAGRATLKIGTVGIASKGIPDIVHVERVVHTLARNGAQETLDFPIASTPVRVEVTIPNTLPPYTVPGDARDLGAQIGFKFVPAKSPR